MNVLLDSVYINSYGGKILLENLIDSINLRGNIKSYFFLIDNRMDSNLLIKIPSNNFYLVEPSEYKRLKFYKKILNEHKISNILCFGNVPPPLKCKNRNIYIYFHNTLLFADNSFLNLKYKLKNIYIRLINSNKYNWIVQTNIVKIGLSKHLHINKKNIKILPFFKLEECLLIPQKENIFFYPADGAKQKNHIFLFRVWYNYFIKYNVSPNLLVTIDKQKYPKLDQIINFYNKKGLNITNLGHLNYKEVLYYYNQSKFVIFPSITESFGLPLIEACNFKCKIIAPNLDYVNEIVIPSLTYKSNCETDLVDKIYYAISNYRLINYSSIKIKNRLEDLIDFINQK